MKRLLALTCIGSLAFAFAATAADEQPNGNKKKAAASETTTVQSTGKVRGNAQVRAPRVYSTTNPHQGNLRSQNNLSVRRQFNNTNVSTRLGGNSNVSTRTNVSGNNVGVSGNAITPRHRADVVVTNNWRSGNFSGPNYVAFRNYHREWHDRDWWHHHYTNIVFVFGAPFFWDAGYWYPCWGYYPSYYYPYDGPIYGYGGLPPDQIIITVQERLQREGYYAGAVDGVLGPMTRQAIADYQADHGLAITAAIDQPTLSTLGLS